MENNEMHWNQTTGLLASTLGALRDLYARIHFADLGVLPAEIERNEIGPETRQERREVTEKELFFDGLLGIYHGLNYAWATRRIDLKRAEREGGVSFKVSPPIEGVFARLVPVNLPGHVAAPRIGDRPVSLPQVRIALQMAFRKLTNLCNRLYMLPGVEIKVRRPKGNDAGVGEQAFDEAEFEQRLFRVYGWLNEAWNCRFEKVWSNDPESADRNCTYPPEVLSHD